MKTGMKIGKILMIVAASLEEIMRLVSMKRIHTFF